MSCVFAVSASRFSQTASEEELKVDDSTEHDTVKPSPDLLSKTIRNQHESFFTRNWQVAALVVTAGPGADGRVGELADTRIWP
jgi:hypothetical protein